MGILRGKLSVVLLSTFSFTSALSSAGAADNRLLERLETGEVISSKIGSSFFVQTLVNNEPEKVQAAFADLSKLPKIFPQIAFARPYSTSDGRQFIYLKLKGLSDGLSVLMEVKAGGGESFQNAHELVLGSDYFQARDTSTEVDTSKEPNQLELKKEIDDANAKGTSARFVVPANSLILEGPLNEVPELPNVRLTINLGISNYMQFASANPPLNGKGALRPVAPVKKTYLVSKVSFGNQISREYLGDYRGFGDQRLALAERIGINVISALKGNLE